MPEIYRAWRTYLLSNPSAQAPTSLWSAAEQRARPNYDLTAAIAYQGFPATVLDVRPSRPGASHEYVVRTLFATPIGDQREIKPIAMTRVHAIREQGRWVFSSPLSHLTRGWREVRLGPIQYVIEPGHRFDRVRGRRAARFVDSLAKVFDESPVQELTYYVTRSREAANRIMGLEWTVGGTAYAWANYANRLIFAGDPALGEESRHELVHLVLGRLAAEGRTHGIVSEGVATWLGGSLHQDFPTLMREYSAFLRSRPDVTLDSILEANDPDQGWNPAGAVLALMAHERGGVLAVKALMRGGRGDDELRAALETILGLPWDAVVARWRARVMVFAAE